KEMQARGEDGQLAPLRLAESAVHAQQVAQVELLGEGPPLLANLLLADIQLDAARPVENLARLVFPFEISGGTAHHRPTRPVHDVKKNDLGFDSPRHDASGGAHALRWLGVRRQGADRLDGLIPVEAAAPGVDAELFNRAELLESAGLVNIWR